jgi:hypothetical protein
MYLTISNNIGYHREKCISSHGTIVESAKKEIVYNICSNEYLPFFENYNEIMKCLEPPKVVLTSFYCGGPLCDKIVQCQVSNKLANILIRETFYGLLEAEQMFRIHENSEVYLVFILGIIVLGISFLKTLCTYTISRIDFYKKRQKELYYAPVSNVTEKLLEDVCTICIEPYEESEKIRTLKCSHIFHKECIDLWKYNGNKRCPLCNEDFC